jgi:hypothetical protein
VAKALGIVDIIWKGRTMQPEKGATYKPGGIKNNAVVGGRKVHHAAEFEAGEVKCTVPWLRDYRIEDFEPGEAGLLQVVCDTGQVFSHDDAFLTERPELKANEGGKVELKWAVGEPAAAYG